MSLERDVVHVRAVLAAPAGVEADQLARHVLQSVVQRLDAQVGVLVVLRRRHVGVHLPAVRQVRVVDLQDEARVRDRLVLLRHRVGDGEEELFFGLVVLVVQPVLHRAGRNRRQVAFDAADALHRGLQVGDVFLVGVLADVLDRPDAEHHARVCPLASRRCRRLRRCRHPPA